MAAPRVALGVVTSLAVLGAATTIFSRGGSAQPEHPPLCGLKGVDECGTEALDCGDAAPLTFATSGAPGLLRDPGDPVPFGFNDAAVLNGDIDPRTDAELQSLTGSRVTRFVLDWGAIETSPGTFNFGQIDNIYCAALRQGIGSLFTVTGVPTWAVDPAVGGCQAPPCVQPPGDHYLPALQRFVGLATDRYPEAVAFEAWNEPNLPAFWPRPDPDRYTALLAAIYRGVKASDPDKTVLGGAVSNAVVDESASGKLSMTTFLDGMFDAGASRYMDALSIHAYPIGRVGAPDDLFTPQLAEAHRIVDELTPVDPKPIWITETGVSTESGSFSPPVLPATQADELTKIYSIVDEDPSNQFVGFHTLIDAATPILGGPGFGWFDQINDSEAIPKPVVCRFREISKLKGCPTRVHLR